MRSSAAVRNFVKHSFGYIEAVPLPQTLYCFSVPLLHRIDIYIIEQVDLCFDDLGWEPRSLSTDLGEDLIVDIYDQGVSAGLAFYVQIKSSSNLERYKLSDGNYSYPLEVKDLNYWRDYFPPVVLVIWDTERKVGYWLTVSDAIAALDTAFPTWEKRKKARVEQPNGRMKTGEEPTHLCLSLRLHRERSWLSR